MAFEKLQIQAGPKRGTAAGITITSTGKSVISLRADIVEAAKLLPGHAFDALLGTDDDAGKLRIVMTEGGGATSRSLPRTGAFFITLGIVAAIGTVRTERVGTTARAINKGVVEIDIPEMSAPNDEDDDGGNTASVDLPAPGETSVLAETYHGITIDFAKGEESVTFGEKLIEVTANQAELVKALARPMPQPVAESFLIKAIWGGAAQKGAAEKLRAMAADLQVGLSPIGLILAPVKGVGYQLKVR